MWTAITSGLASALRITADFVDGFNSADMVAQKKAQLKQAAVDRVNADVAQGRVADVQKDVAS